MFRVFERLVGGKRGTFTRLSSELAPSRMKGPQTSHPIPDIAGVTPVVLALAVLPLVPKRTGSTAGQGELPNSIKLTFR